jgi:hypothetical protein
MAFEVLELLMIPLPAPGSCVTRRAAGGNRWMHRWFEGVAKG